MTKLTDFLKKSKDMNIVKKRIIEKKLEDLKEKRIKERIIETNLQDLKNNNSSEKKFIKVNKGDKLY